MLLEQLFTDLYTNSGDKTAFVFDENSKVKKISFREFIEDVYRGVDKLANIKGESIALIANTSYSWIKNFFIILLSENIAVLIDPDSSEDKINYMIKDSECSYIFLENNLELLSKINSKYLYRVYINELVFGKIISGRQKKIVSGTEYNIVIYTSGSNGLPKGVMLSSDEALNNANSVCRRVKFEEGLFLILPLYHAYAMEIGLFAMFCCKNWVYVSKKHFDLEEVKASGAKAILAVPAMVEFMQRKIESIRIGRTAVERPSSETTLASIVVGKLHQIMCGGAFLKEETELFCLENNFDLITGYGMTECGTVIAAENTQLKRIGSVGKILDCYEAKIENQHKDRFGEILVRGTSLMKGYLNDTKKLNSDNFFATGDIGIIDDDGYLYIQGRIKNLIVFNNGEKMVPEELEKHLKKIEHVDDAIVSLYKGINAEYVVAVVELDDMTQGNKALVYDAIMEINGSLPFYKRIEKVIFGEQEVERSSLGKIRRSEISKFVERELIPIQLLKILENISGIPYDKILIKHNLVTDLGIDSLGMYSLLVQLQNESSANIQNENIKNLKTVEDIVENYF